MPGGVEEVDGSHHVGHHEFEGVGDAAVNMRFGREVNHPVELVLGKELLNEPIVNDVAFHEGVVVLVLKVFEVG